MKVYIGPYLSWFGVYQLVSLLEFFGVSKDKCYEIGKELDHKFPWINNFLQWIYSLRKRKVKIQVDYYDTWNMDHTLALIILPMLKQLKETKHGSPVVDMNDVPESLRCEPACEENNWDDKTIHDRWEWVMGEMIYAFESILKEEENVENDIGVYEAEHARVSNGFRLFGKYYQGLWD